ncbi:MAG: F510_1955 family glycosylhydrolase [Rhodoferax sp.]
MSRTLRPLAATLFMALALAFFRAAPAAAAVALPHVHGLSYSADGKRLYVPSHQGLAVYAGGRWSRADGAPHDYMGFAATRSALYSSGHPAPGTGLTNPFGLIKSVDEGKTWQKLGLEGESDFHLLATAYETNAVYVFNHQPNSRMGQVGIHFTVNDGLRWQHAQAHGLPGSPHTLAVHPRDHKTLTAGTDAGLYLSTDAGASFRLLLSGPQVLAQAFDLDGEHLWVSAYAGKAASLLRTTLRPGAKPESRPLPVLGEDAVAYLAQNPRRRQEWAIATFKKNVFVSADAGKTWRQIARDGEGMD